MYRLVISPQQNQEGQIILSKEQQHYLQRVLRLKNGDRFVAMDGQGLAWIAEIAENSAKVLEPLRDSTELPVAITLMVALPKGNGFEQVVRCCTELGTSCFVPIISDRTLLKPSSHKLERWRRIAREAAEQSERQIVPTIWEPMRFSTALARIMGQENEEINSPANYICVARYQAKHLLHCLETRTSEQMAIATGPEGGWTPQEIEAAIAAGFQPVSLGRSILRAVTAPVVAVSLAAAQAQRCTHNS